MKLKIEIDKLLFDKRVSIDEFAKVIETTPATVYNIRERKTIKLIQLRKAERKYGDLTNYIH